MKPRKPEQTTFSGVLASENGRYFLRSGGITAQLEPTSGAAGALSGRVGQTVRVAGRLTEARIDRAQLADEVGSEAAEAAAPDVGRFAAIFAAIDRESAALQRKPNVVSVRPGYRRVAGHLTREPAIVVAVRRKVRPEDLEEKDKLPREVEGVPVDVVMASPLETLSTGAASAGGVESCTIVRSTVRVAPSVSATVTTTSRDVSAASGKSSSKRPSPSSVVLDGVSPSRPDSTDASAAAPAVATPRTHTASAAVMLGSSANCGTMATRPL